MTPTHWSSGFILRHTLIACSKVLVTNSALMLDLTVKPGIGWLKPSCMNDMYI